MAPSKIGKFMLPKELRSRRLLLRVSLEDLAARLGLDPLLLAHMESGDAPITPSVTLALEALERERADTRNS
jgi:transcriptional regulator with XRE-family HTH domain